jgi:Flp pilus assembly pilin Flp
MPLRRREDGQAIVEYAMILGGISLVLIAAFVVAGLDDAFTTLVDRIAAELS